MEEAAEAGIPPWRFWALTPREIRAASKGYERRWKAETRRLAWVTANLLNAWVRDRVTPDQLLGEQSETISAEEFDSVEEWRAALRERRRAMEEE